MPSPTFAPVPRANPRPLVVLALLLACLCGLARFHDLDRMVVWHDEVFSVARVLGYDHAQTHDAVYGTGRILRPDDLLRVQRPDPDHGWGDTWHALRGHPEHGPLYYLIGRLGTELAEPAIVGLRGTSAALSLLLLPAMAWLARELFGRGAAPWFAIALVAVAPIHLLYAQEARQYALWSALIAASSAALLRALRRERGGDWALYGGLLAIGLYTHLLMALVAAVHAGYGLWRSHGDRSALRRFIVRFAAAAGGASLLFLPWLVVVLGHWDEMRNYTGWMATPARPAQLATAWANHLARPFVDLPELPLAWLAVIPLLAMAVRYRDRQSDRRLLWLLALVPLALVAIPDLLVGGRRSLESRYLMPTFLALELLCAGALGHAWAAGGTKRRLAIAGLVLAVSAGLLSQLRILTADSWWTKSYSARNAAFAELVNSKAHPLILASDGAVNTGELVSLSYRLQPHVRLLPRSDDTPPSLPPGYSDLFALLPGDKLRAWLQADYVIQPFPGTWQWFSLVRREPSDRAAP